MISKVIFYLSLSLICQLSVSNSYRLFKSDFFDTPVYSDNQWDPLFAAADLNAESNLEPTYQKRTNEWDIEKRGVPVFVQEEYNAPSPGFKYNFEPDYQRPVNEWDIEKRGVPLYIENEDDAADNNDKLVRVSSNKLKLIIDEYRRLQKLTNQSQK